MVHLVESQDLKVHKEYRVNKGLKEYKVYKVKKVIREILAHKEYKVKKVKLEQMVKMELVLVLIFQRVEK